MGAQNSGTTSVLLLLLLSAAFLVRLTRGQAFPHRLLDPFSRFSWVGPFPGRQPPPRHLTSATRSDPRVDDIPGHPDPDLEDFAEFYPSPEHAAAAAAAFAKKFGDLSISWDKPTDAQGSDQHPRKLPGPQLPVDEGQNDVDKRPLDTVGSGVMKKDLEEADPRKRALDRLGIGLMKRPLDELGQGLLKKRLRPSEGEMNLHHPPTKDSLEDDSPAVDPERLQRADGRQSAMELMKKGLDVLGNGIFKRGADDSRGLVQIRMALDQLSQGLGANGDPDKGVDVDMVRRSLDRLGTGLLKRGLDTVGIGLIKRAVDNLDAGLIQRASSKYLNTEGLELLRKGLDHLQTDLIKAGFDRDAVRMISRGAVSFASWLIQHRSSIAAPPYVKMREPAKDDYDSGDYSLSKKSLDRVGIGLMKKGAGNEDLAPLKDEDMKSKTPLEQELSGWDPKRKKDLRKKLKYEHFKANNLHKYADFKMSQIGKHAARNAQRYADIKAAFHDDQPDEKTAQRGFEKFSKDTKPEPKAKGSDYIPMPPRKKGLDEVGSGFIKKGLDEVGSGFLKKDLDYVGSGLMKKDSGVPAPMGFPHPDAALQKQRPHDKDQREWPQAPYNDDRQDKLITKKYDKKPTHSHEK